MFPSIHSCQKISGASRDAVEEFDGRVRLALSRVIADWRRSSSDADPPLSAVVTVLMSIAADAALITDDDEDQHTHVEFEALARDAFSWALNKKHILDNV